MIWSLLTSKLAGPIGAGLSLVLLLTLAAVKIENANLKATAKTWREAYYQADENYRTAKRNTDTLTNALHQQSAAVRALGEESRRRQASAAKALASALQGRRSAEERASRLLARPPAGIDACARMESADKAVLESLEP